MSNQVFPSLIGLGFNVVRSPRWSNSMLRSVSGKTTRVSYWSYPIWTWTLTFDFLRSDPTNAEWQNLVGFFNGRKGGFDSFLFDDVDDDTVVGQTLGIGAGAATTFQLVRTLGGFVEPIYAPNVVSNVYVNGVPKTVGVDYTVSTWGAAAPGVVTFAVAPTGVITADFTYYFPCRFTDDVLEFTKFMNQLWRGQKVSFESIR